MRWALVGAGTLAGLYGVWLAVTRQEPAQLLEIGVWLIAGILAHDVLVTVLASILLLLVVRLLPMPWQAPAVVAVVVWGGVSLAVLPVLGRWGAQAANPTHLDRPYLASWLVITALVLLAVGLAGVVRSRRGDHSSRPADR